MTRGQVLSCVDGHLETAYSTFASLWVRAWPNPITSDTLKWSHPMRMSRYVFSERFSPAMVIAAALAPIVRANRSAVGDEDRFQKAERTAIDRVETGHIRTLEAQGGTTEHSFSWLYDWPSLNRPTQDQARDK